MQGQGPEKTANYLRVRVVDHTKEGHPAVTIKVPIGVVKWGMKMAQAFSPQMKDVNLDWDSIDAMVQTATHHPPRHRRPSSRSSGQVGRLLQSPLVGGLGR